MKIVVNKCYGGFGLSVKAVLWLHKHGFDVGEFKYPAKKYFGKKDFSKELNEWKDYLKSKKNKKSEREAFFMTIFSPDEEFVLSTRIDYEHRTHPLLIKCIEELGEEEASGDLARLRVIEIPDGMNYEISDYDGVETVHERHRSW